jgi:hypothetical protein
MTGFMPNSAETALKRARLLELLQADPRYGQLTRAAEKECLPFSLLTNAPGVPRGALTQLHGPCGSGKSELALRFLAENPQARAAWIERELTIYPCAFPLAGVGLERVLFVEAGEQQLWAAHQILRSRLFEVVVLAGAQFQEMELRRLQLSSEKARASVLLLTDSPDGPPARAWPVALQLEVRRNALRPIRLMQPEGDDVPQIRSIKG